MLSTQKKQHEKNHKTKTLTKTLKPRVFFDVLIIFIN